MFEIIIILAVLGVILAVVMPQFGKSRETQVLNGAVGDILSSINKARTATLASLDSSAYGVRFETDTIIIFKGTSFSVNAPDNEEINILAPAAISNVTLGGVSASTGDFYFNRISGSPSKYGAVTVSAPNLSKIITITATGSASAD